ncbi:MAG: RluA family pseudouridine synthase [Candidatus Yanofskybacteria bacterium]|nr:RluA family pseudouridine synthase [Candidatus Yanofskybacteria bacterium]
MARIKIIYENRDFLIIDKPAGLLTHPVRSLARAKGASPEDLGEATSNGTHPVNRQDKSESVVGWLLEKYPEVASVCDPYGTGVGSSSTSLEEPKLVLDKWTDLRPGIVHRLDRETSGLLLAAKTQSAFDYFKKLFQEHKIKKTYLALVYGHLKNKSGVIETPLAKLPGRTGSTRQTTKVHGKHELKEKSAITQYKVLSYHLLHTASYSLLEVSPQTGRTHQIRVHLKSVGHPVVCDALYAGKNNTCPPGLGRLFLHAQKLSFVSPAGEALTAETDLPQELNEFLSTLEVATKDY